MLLRCFSNLIGALWIRFISQGLVLSGLMCVEISDLVVPPVVESGREPWVDLSCCFSYKDSEKSQLDIKWYFKHNVEPFLQWVPSTGRPTQIIADFPFNGRLDFQQREEPSVDLQKKEKVDVHKTDQLAKKSKGKDRAKRKKLKEEEAKQDVKKSGKSRQSKKKGSRKRDKSETVEKLYKWSHHIRVKRPTSELSGAYTCKVSTFEMESIKKSHMIVYDQGEGPVLLYYSSSLHEINVTCTARQVYPQPTLKLHWGDISGSGEVETEVVQRDLSYSVTVHKVLQKASIPIETVLSCSMHIPGTSFTLTKQTMYHPAKVNARRTQVSRAPPPSARAAINFVVIAILISLAQAIVWPI